jgi:hypothetical protein
MKRSLVLVLAAAFGLSATLSVARAGTQTGTNTAAGVTSYVSMTYNSQYCPSQSAMKYQIFFVEYRWYRQFLDRTVRARTNYGELGSICQGGIGTYQAGISEYTPCWACNETVDPHWTTSYVHYAPQNWDYVGEPYTAPHVGAWAESTVVGSGGGTLATMCTQAYAVGGYC